MIASVQPELLWSCVESGMVQDVILQEERGGSSLVVSRGVGDHVARVENLLETVVLVDAHVVANSHVVHHVQVVRHFDLFFSHVIELLVGEGDVNSVVNVAPLWCEAQSLAVLGVPQNEVGRALEVVKQEFFAKGSVVLLAGQQININLQHSSLRQLGWQPEQLRCTFAFSDSQGRSSTFLQFIIIIKF